MMHEVDLLPTLLAAAGTTLITPKDRKIDGVNQLPFMEGRQEHSLRSSSIFLAREGHIMAIKWKNWKLWYNFKTELPDPNPDNLVRLHDMHVDPQEEIDVKDFYPWVISVMDSIAQEYEASLISHPRVPGHAKDPYVPSTHQSDNIVKAYKRTDRKKLSARSEALPNPNFSGTWSTKTLHTRSPIGRPPDQVLSTLGSGWGDKISIHQNEECMEVERVFYVPREIQPLMKHSYSLNGSTSENEIYMGRSGMIPKSMVSWDGNRMVITTAYTFQNPENLNWEECIVTQTLWLEPAKGTPWEPRLVVETERGAALGGKSSINRTFYTRGYR